MFLIWSRSGDDPPQHGRHVQDAARFIGIEFVILTTESLDLRENLGRRMTNTAGPGFRGEAWNVSDPGIRGK